MTIGKRNFSFTAMEYLAHFYRRLLAVILTLGRTKEWRGWEGEGGSGNHLSRDFLPII